MKYNAVIFDLDGTLLDTLEDLTNSVNYALTFMGWPLRNRTQIREYLGNGIGQLIKLSIPEDATPSELELVTAKFKEHYEVHNLDNTKPYEGIIEVLKTLKDKGIKMAIVSNKIDEAVITLKNKFFADYIDIAVGDRPNQKRKPAPDSCNLVIEQLGLTRKETVYVGDSEVDVATANNAGLDCISVLWGFRDKEDLEEIGVKVFANNMEELEKEVLG